MNGTHAITQRPGAGGDDGAGNDYAPLLAMLLAVVVVAGCVGAVFCAIALYRCTRRARGAVVVEMQPDTEKGVFE